MGEVSKSANGTNHGNTVVVHKIKIYFQVYPGVGGTDAQRGIPGVPYSVEIVDSSGIGLESSGTTAKDGGVEIGIGAGESAILTIFDTEYKITSKRGIIGVEAAMGVKQRLSGLGYYLKATDPAVDKETRLALLNFQADSNLNADGEFNGDEVGNMFINEVTQKQLKKDFGQ